MAKKNIWGGGLTELELYFAKSQGITLQELKEKPLELPCNTFAHKEGETENEYWKRYSEVKYLGGRLEQEQAELLSLPSFGGDSLMNKEKEL